MKSKTIAIALAFFWFWNQATAATPSQVEFSAKLTRVEKSAPRAGILVMKVTDQQSLELRVTPSTEVRDENEIHVDLDTLRPGDTLKVEAIVTDQGFLATEVEIEEDASQFELKGEIETIRTTNRTIVVAGVTLAVPATTEIRDDRGGLLSFSEIERGWFVKAEGMAGATPVLSELRVLPPRTARIRLEGKAVEATRNQLLLEIPGAIRVPVLINEDTQINGSLAVGARLDVRGRLTPGLLVQAERVEVEKPLRLVPDEIHLDIASTGRVDFVLGQPLLSDSTLELVSRNPSIAIPVPASLALPAGALTGSFDVMSMSVEGRTVIDASLTGAQTLSAFLEVEVETEQGDDNQNELLEVRWNPRKITSAGARDVRLELNGPAPEDLVIPLSLKDGVPGLVTFPDQVEIPAGERAATVPITVADQSGRVKVRARLPLSVGGDTDDLEIELEAENEARLELEWSPDDIELAPSQQVVVSLRLDRPAPFDTEVVISVKDGDPNVVMGVPATALFIAGQSQAQFTVVSSGLTGEVRFRAALPVQSGGDSDDLRVRVRR